MNNNLTKDHFKIFNYDNKLSESNESSDLDNNSDKESNCSDSSISNSDDFSNNTSELLNSSESENNSNDENSNSEDESDYSAISINSDSSSESDSEDLKIDDNDLFNTKTNGNEFYGDVLNNRFLILKKLGYGSFSSVWMAYDINNINLVAIKIINPDDYKEGLLEINIYEKLKKINSKYLLTMNECFQVVPIHYKYYTDEYKKNNNVLNDHIVMVLPLLACSTYDLLKCNEYKNGLPLDVCKNIVFQTLLAIKDLENINFMHTDLKPENILVCGLNREAELLLNTIKEIDIKSVHNNKFKELKEKLKEDEWKISYNIYKGITKTLVKFIKNNMKEVHEEMKICKVSSKYIKNIEIKLCDFNLVINADSKIDNKFIEIQTRYYRAPEIILASGLHKKTDYWSIGCILFELLTGDLLFDPKRTKNMIRDTHHIYLIENLRGLISQDILNNSRRYKKIFENYPKKNKLKKNTLSNIFENNYKNLGLSDILIKNIIDFLSSTLSINPADRPSINTMLLKIENINKI